MAKKKLEKASDHYLMELTKDGDEDAFRIIVQRYKDPLTNYIYRIINDYDTAIDISQEVFIRVYRKASSYQPLAAFSTWIYRISTNLAINEIRKRKKYFTVSIFSRLNDYENSYYEMPYSDESALNPEEEIGQIQLRSKVREVLNSLPIKYRIPLLLRELEDYSYDDIAKIVGVPQGTIKSRINRGRYILKNKLKDFQERI
ncbi:RNA polymerase sigma factor [candidate division CSSED10-310 bacterium]|uniref:RNA polymerase sigma factor n=1 Tax=candidate division CSSED10-310 bacterium TaxID=2855610 RepID=A0ABV6YU42_UNCC1